MLGFKKYKLGEVLDIIMGQSPDGATCNKNNNGTPLLNGPTEFGEKFPTAVQYTTDPKKFSEEGDILFCVRGSTTGRMNFSDRQYAIGRGLAAIRHKKGKHLQSFVRGLIDTILSGMLQNVTGSTFPNLSKEQLNNYEVQIPEDLPTQTRIASILSSLDDKIELNRRTNHTLEQIAQTLFKKYFVDDIDQENLPEGWRWGKLGDVTCKITKGTTPTTLKKQFALSGINFLKVENLTESGTFDKSKLNFIDEETDKLLSRSRIQDKDILFSIAGTLGRIALVNENILPANTNQALAIIRPDMKIIEPLFIYYWLKEATVREEIFSKSVQGVQANLSLGVLSDIDIIIPSKDILGKKFENINPIYKKIEQNEIEISLLTSLRDSLLPKLMSGEIEVNATEKELVK